MTTDDRGASLRGAPLGDAVDRPEPASGQGGLDPEAEALVAASLHDPDAGRAAAQAREDFRDELVDKDVAQLPPAQVDGTATEHAERKPPTTQAPRVEDLSLAEAELEQADADGVAASIDPAEADPFLPDPSVRDEGVVASMGIDDLGHMTDTGIYEGELAARVPGSDQPDELVAENLERLEALELRAGETEDPDVAAEEGMTWVPPTDPPVSGSEDGDPRIAAGFGATSLAEPYDLDHHRDVFTTDDEMTARVREALLADATTSQYSDGLDLDTAGGIVRLRGVVEDLEDEENVLAVTSTVTGVGEIRNELTVRTLE
jgi:BON domain